MDTLRGVLEKAAGGGLIAETQVAPLEAYLVENGVVAAGVSADDNDVRDTEPGVVDTEAPRFIRGFHDVLITIGLVILLAGGWGIGFIFATIPLTIVLAEILVVRQRLALPAVVLTLSMLVWTKYVADFALSRMNVSSDGLPWLLSILAFYPLIMWLFYWRYRIPVALSVAVLSVFLFVGVLLLHFLQIVTGSADFIVDYPLAFKLLLLTLAVCLFTVALRFDLSDPARVTRRSDIAFWLHLGAAPALLYAMLSFVFLSGKIELFSLEKSQAYGSAAEVLIVVVILMLIGIVIDRRAFVTSGLMSLIGAVIAILSHGDIEGRVVIFIGLLVVGVVVLTLGIGWPRLRRLLVGRLPDSLKAKLPPLR